MPIWVKIRRLEARVTQRQWKCHYTKLFTPHPSSPIKLWATPWHPILLKEIGYLILALPSDKVSGEDYIPGDLLKTIIVW